MTKNISIDIPSSGIEAFISLSLVEPSSKISSIASASFNSFVSQFLSETFSEFSPFGTSLLILSIVSSSATKEVVILTSGNTAILEAWLKIAIETPTAASATGPRKEVHHYVEISLKITYRPFLPFKHHMPLPKS